MISLSRSSAWLKHAGVICLSVASDKSTFLPRIPLPFKFIGFIVCIMAVTFTIEVLHSSLNARNSSAPSSAYGPVWGTLKPIVTVALFAGSLREHGRQHRRLGSTTLVHLMLHLQPAILSKTNGEKPSFLVSHNQSPKFIVIRLNQTERGIVGMSFATGFRLENPSKFATIG